MTTEAETARREAAEWHILLCEAPDDPGLRAQFAQWRDSDTRHARAWQSMERTFGTLAALDEEVHDRLLTAGANRQPDDVRNRPRRWIGRSAIAFVIACIGLFVAVQTPDLAVRLASDHATGAAETGEVILADGSVVRLGPETAIAVAYSDGRRDVRLLKGLAHFTVLPDRDRPFAVTADEAIATVLGTAFDVATYDDATSIAVQHGHVRVTAAHESAMAAADLRAGDWLRVGARRQPARGHVPADFIGAWWSGRLMVRDAPIADIVQRIRPWYSGRIVVLDDALMARRVTGVYDPRDPVAALKALVSPYGGTVTQITPWALIIASG